MSAKQFFSPLWFGYFSILFSIRNKNRFVCLPFSLPLSLARSVCVFTVPIVVLPICLDASSELLALSSVSGGDVSTAAADAVAACGSVSQCLCFIFLCVFCFCSRCCCGSFQPEIIHSAQWLCNSHYLYHTRAVKDGVCVPVLSWISL